MNGRRPVALLAPFVLLPAFCADAAAGVHATVGSRVPVAPAAVAFATAAAVVPPVPPPECVVLVPNTSIYFVPEVGFDLFFTRGYWWTCNEGRWLRSRSHGGPWTSVSRRTVPEPLLRLPRHYRSAYHGEERIPYGQLKAHRGEWRQPGEGEGRRRRKEDRGHAKRDD